LAGFLKSVLILGAALGISYLFFHPTLNNSFWYGDDFTYLSHNLRMTEHPSAVFDDEPPYKFQPLVYAVSYVLFKHFAFEPRGYFLFNMLLHGFNAFLVYLLVQTLLKDRAVALLSGLLFVFTVGNYGKAVMIMSGLEDLIITMLALCTMIFYFVNELKSGGRMRTPWFILTLVFFVASVLTRSTSFSILGAFLAFDYFFRRERGRRVISANFIVLLVIAAIALVFKTNVFHYRPSFYAVTPGPVKFVLYAVKNVIGYLVRMIFPIHTSELVAEAGPAVRFVYSLATEIRIVIALVVISYSFFGFIFGNHTIRFFIAWTYIMVIPFAFFQLPKDWLNIRHLYLVSIGYVMVISAGAVYCSRLIAHHAWRRLVPFAVPAFLIVLARFIVTQLDHSYEIKAASPATIEHLREIAHGFPGVTIEGDKLRFEPGSPGSGAGSGSTPVHPPASGDAG
jgi:hypothetical protein